MLKGTRIAFRLRKTDDDINLLFHYYKPTSVARTVINAMLKNKRAVFPLPFVEYEPPKLDRCYFNFNSQDIDILSWLQGIDNGNRSAEIRKLIINAIELSNQVNPTTSQNNRVAEYRNDEDDKKLIPIQQSPPMVDTQTAFTPSSGGSGILDALFIEQE